MVISFTKRFWTFIGACIVALAVFQLPASAQAASFARNTHLLSIGICPPWKPQPASACEKSVEATGKGLTQRLGISDKNWHKLLNEQATTRGLFKKLADLSGKLGPDDRLIIYVNLHAGSLDPSKPAGPENDVFVLWSEEKPDVMAFAVAQGLWIEAKEFARRVHQISAGEVVLIMDACEAGAVTPLFIDHHPDDDEARPEAVITSAEFNQFANMSSDGSMALYSEMLASVLKTQNGPLGDALSKTASLTEKAAIPICKKQAGTLEKYGQNPAACNQQPTAHDPQNILSKLQLKAL